MSRWSFRFLLFYITILFTQPQNRFVFLYPFRIANLCALMAIGLHVLSANSEGRPLLRFGPATVLGLVLMAMAFLSHHFGPYPGSGAWTPAIDVLMKNALVMILVEAMAYNVPRVWAVFTTMTVSTLWWIKGGLRLGSAGVIYSGGRIMGPAVSMIENPNGFAYLMTATIPMYLYFYHTVEDKRVKWGFLACSIASAYIVFNTGSRSGFLCLLACGAMVLPRLLGRHKRGAILVALAISIIWSQTDPRNIERFRSILVQVQNFFSAEEADEDQLMRMTQDEHSAHERKMKNRDTWRLIKDHPAFGAGISADQRLYSSQYPFAWGQVHNELLMAGTHFGFPGMVMYLGFLGILGINGLRLYLRTRTWWPEMSQIGWMFMTQGVIIFVGGMFAPWPWNPYTMLLFGVASSLYGMITSPATLPTWEGQSSGYRDLAEDPRLAGLQT